MWGYEGFQLAGGVRLGGAFESSRMGDDSCRGNVFNHHASQGRSTEGKDPVSQDAGECGAGWCEALFERERRRGRRRTGAGGHIQ